MRILLITRRNPPSSAAATPCKWKKPPELRELGVGAKISTAPEPDARGYDIAHVFNLRTIDATERQVSALARHGVRILRDYTWQSVAKAALSAYERALDEHAG